MTISCLEAEVKKTNVSALVIHWEESNDCWEDDKHFLPVLHKLLMGLSSLWYNVMFIWIPNVAHWNYAPYLRGQDLVWEDGIWKHFQQRRGNVFFKIFPHWLESWNCSHWGMQIFYRCNIFNSKQPTIIHVKWRQAGIEIQYINQCKARLYRHALFLSYITTPSRLECLHSVSGALMDHPLGPLISSYRRWRQTWSKAHTLCSADPTRPPFVICSASALFAWIIWNV